MKGAKALNKNATFPILMRLADSHAEHESASGAPGRPANKSVINRCLEAFTARPMHLISNKESCHSSGMGRALVVPAY
jgi:hypothetical protein